jgi:hypothetical protein
MQERKFKNKKNYLLAFIMGTFVFVAIFIFTNSLSSIESNRIYSIQGEMAQDIFKDKLIYSFFEEHPCSGESFSKISKDLGNSGRIIDDLERKLGKDDKNILEQKKFYTLILLEHFEFVKTYNKICNVSTPTILFFYSNKKEDINNNEEMGRILSIVANGHPEVVIYSFDINLDSELIKKLVNKYNVLDSPTIIVNEKTILGGITSFSSIEKYLN